MRLEEGDNVQFSEWEVVCRISRKCWASAAKLCGTLLSYKSEERRCWRLSEYNYVRRVREMKSFLHVDGVVHVV